MAVREAGSPGRQVSAASALPGLTDTTRIDLAMATIVLAMTRIVLIVTLLVFAMASWETVGPMVPRRRVTRRWPNPRVGAKSLLRGQGFFLQVFANSRPGFKL